MTLKDSSSLPQQSLTCISMSEDPKETSILETVPNKQRTFSASVPKTPDSVDVELEEITACSLLGSIQNHN